MNRIFTLILILSSSTLFAQSSKITVFGNWIKTKVEYKGGEELSDEQGIKYSYLRYSLEKPDKAFIGWSFDDKGTAMTFSINDGVLELKNSFGHPANSFLIERQSADELILLQMGQEGFDSPDCIRYYFVAEAKYQKAIPLKSADILAINGADTLYASSPKIYAKYKGATSFHDFLTSNIPAYKDVVASDNFFLASFIVRKTGEIDSLQILESISPSFDRQFAKAFNKAKGKWQPATLNGRSVDVRMQEQFRFISSGKFLPSYDYSQKGHEAMKAKEYVKALYYFDRGLESLPSDPDMLYKRAVCKIQLGNIASACENLQKMKALGNTTADALMERTCH